MSGLPQNPSEAFKRLNPHIYGAPARPLASVYGSDGVLIPPKKQNAPKAKQRKIRNHENYPDPRLSDTKPAQQAGALDTDHARKASGARCPLVRFTLCRVKLLDVDAKYGSVKDLLDGLAYAGLIRGDKEGQICLEVEQVKVSHYAEEKTVIEIDYPIS